MPSREELLKKAQAQVAKPVPSSSRNLDALKAKLDKTKGKKPNEYKHETTITTTADTPAAAAEGSPTGAGFPEPAAALKKEPVIPVGTSSVDGVLTFEDLQAKKWNKAMNYVVPWSWIDFEDSQRVIGERETYNRDPYEILKETPSFKSLVIDIKDNGQQVAGRVRPNEFGLLKITDGWRRALAGRDAGTEGYLCTITEESDQEAAVNALRLNLMREDLPEYNKLFEIKRLNDQFNMTYEAIAKRVGYGDKTYLSDCLNIFKVPAVEKALKAKQLSISTGRHVARKALKDKLDQAQAEKLVMMVVKREVKLKDLSVLDVKAGKTTPKAPSSPILEVKDDGSFTYQAIRFKPGAMNLRDLDKTIGHLEEIIKLLKKDAKDRRQ